MPIDEHIKHAKNLKSEVVYKDKYEVPISNDQIENMNHHAFEQSKRSKSTRHISNYDPLTTHGYHEYNGKIYEPVTDFGNYNYNSSYNNYGNYDAHHSSHLYSSPTHHSSSHLGKNYSKSHRSLSHVNNYHGLNLEEENRMLKKELHELRKMEAGWFGKNKNYVKKEVIVKNNHYLDEKLKITNEVTNLRERYSALE